MKIWRQFYLKSDKLQKRIEKSGQFHQFFYKTADKSLDVLTIYSFLKFGKI
ncbi:hypothetical protein HMPREF0027_0459 [Actinobacillus ureae ATCC 25976]|uniref:Uncharacterized protein n=1 Tax=Actinobacillus ureae ATCC 25976 TaxID=887324 RepID=E8KF42_9PAST|nr:hypothetical protein HMPREF0027_0459 [Actinobacillus ureae ATCC 25976]